MNRRNNHPIYFTLLVVGCLISCKENEIEIIDPSTYGYDYYPVAIGKSWTYQTDSILFKKQVVIEIDTITSFQREEITDTFRNAENELVYRIDVFYALDTNLAWEQVNSFFIQKDNQQLNKTENGLQYTKLVFPIRKNKSWYGNNTISPKTEIVILGETIKPFTDDWFYNYTYTDKMESIGNFNFVKVCKVSESDDENLLEKRFSIAKYAYGVGMVYKEQWLLDTQVFDSNIPFEEKAEKGMILRQILISFN